ncbi:MAG: aldehyde dehydrogenase family protein [Steroidobacteraceae bacterium]
MPQEPRRGVVNFITADRPVSELLVRDPRVDKISFTGSVAAGKRIGALCGERIARCTLELGGKSAAVVLDDYDIDAAAESILGPACAMTGQICGSLTRVIVSRSRHDALVEALSSRFAQVKVGDPFDPAMQMGPVAMKRQLERIERLIAAGVNEGARLADSDEHAVELANDTPFGLNNSVFTHDADRAYRVARRLLSGTVGHNVFRTDFSIAFGGFKQSGVGREGGVEGLRAFLEAKTIILDGRPAHIRD